MNTKDNLDKPYLFVNFNETTNYGYLLSKTDMTLDINGKTVNITEGMNIYAWDGDQNENNEDCILVADGFAVLNTNTECEWCHKDKVKWCCRIDTSSFRHEMKDTSKWDIAMKQIREIQR
jgi:hypothetical protein